MPFFAKGTIIKSPYGDEAYRVTRDVASLEMARPDHFEPLGGAPEPKRGALMPKWLGAAVNRGTEAAESGEVEIIKPH